MSKLFLSFTLKCFHLSRRDFREQGFRRGILAHGNRGQAQLTEMLMFVVRNVP